MKVLLMFRDQDFDVRQKLPLNEQALTQDLDLSTLFKTMARGDEVIQDVAKSAIACGMNNTADTIRYRQEVLRDCLKNPALIGDIYTIAIAAIQGEKKSYRRIFRYPGAVLSESLEVMQLFVTLLKRLRQVADTHADEFESEGFRTLFAMLQRELDD
ncbi:MAG: MutS-related protein, partial [Gammaproteobacteria bacterium]